jgi:hypothetical protein
MNMHHQAVGVLGASLVAMGFGMVSIGSIEPLSVAEASRIRGAQATQCYSTLQCSLGSPDCTDVCASDGCEDPVTVEEQTPTQVSGSNEKIVDDLCSDDDECTYETTEGDNCIIPPGQPPLG